MAEEGLTVRFLFALLSLAGAALAFGYPVLVSQFGGREVARVEAYRQGEAVAGATVLLEPVHAPVGVNVEMVPSRQPTLTSEPVEIGLVVGYDGLDVLARAIAFAGNAQSGSRQSLPAGTIETISSGPYAVEVTVFPNGNQPPERIDVVFAANALAMDARAQPVGFVAMALGFMGLVIASARRRRVAGTQTATRDNPRWGRGAKD